MTRALAALSLFLAACGGQSDVQTEPEGLQDGDLLTGFGIYNRSELDLRHVYIDSPNVVIQSNDVLEGRPLSPGLRREVSGLTCGSYAIQVEHATRRCRLGVRRLCTPDSSLAIEQSDLDGCDGVAVGGTVSSDPEWWTGQVTVVNQTGWDLMALRVTVQDSEETQTIDSLKGALLFDGASVALNDMPCKRATFGLRRRNGQTCEGLEVDLCVQSGSVVLTSQMVQACAQPSPPR